MSKKLQMNFDRAIALIKSQCPNHWARMHARALRQTKVHHGQQGVYVQVLFMLEALAGWDEPYGVAKFLRGWAERQKKTLQHAGAK